MSLFLYLNNILAWDRKLRELKFTNLKWYYDNNGEAEDHHKLDLPDSIRFESLQKIQHKHEVFNFMGKVAHNVLVTTNLSKYINLQKPYRFD